MRNVRTITKILILVITMLALMGTIAFVGYRTSIGITKAVHYTYENYTLPAMWILEAKAQVIQIRRLVVRIFNEGNIEEIPKIEEIVLANRKIFDEYLNKYQRTDLTKEETDALNNLKKLEAEVTSKHGEIIAAAKSQDEGQKMSLSLRLFQYGDITLTENAYLTAFTDLANMLTRLADEANANVESTADRAAMTIMTVTFFSVIVGVVLALFISRCITQPMTTTQKSIENFAKGDLTSTFSTYGRDEIAVMAQNLHRMSESLKDVIRHVNTTSINVSETAHDFSAMAEETNASVGAFRSNIDEMGANLEALDSVSDQISVAVKEVALGAQTTADKGTDIAKKVDAATTAGDAGMSAVHNVVDGIGRVAASSRRSATAVTELGNSARQIQGFVSQISGIADQTNLLALNAAIEAARAGEAGRGFAVVAEEVRKLAEESNVAAKNITELASAVTSELDTIVSYAQESASDSETAKKLSSETEKAIKNMIDYLHDIAEATQDLAAVAEEQAASSEEMTEAIRGMSEKIATTANAGKSIRESVAEVALASERIAEGAESLSSLSLDLQEELTFFHMEKEELTDSSRENVSGIKALPGQKG